MNKKEVIEITEDEYHELEDEYGGICLSCHNRQYGVEPDARNYKCEECEENQVYGIQELLISGLLVLS